MKIGQRMKIYSRGSREPPWSNRKNIFGVKKIDILHLLTLVVSGNDFKNH